jgi:hypothetical protein
MSKLNGEVLDTFYAELRRCRVRRDWRRGGVDHRTKTEHECRDTDQAPRGDRHALTGRRTPVT